MKRLQFDEKLEALVDEKGVEYEGRRFGTTVTYCSVWCSSLKEAEREALDKLEELATSHGADAYEVTNVQTFDSRQEYDCTPYTAAASAILYKTR